MQKGTSYVVVLTVLVISVLTGLLLFYPKQPIQQPTQLYRLNEKDIFDDVNGYRVQNNLQPLEWSPFLCTKLEVRFAEIDAAFNHDGFEDKTSEIFADGSPYSRIGENLININTLARTPGGAAASWMKSPTHRGAILYAEYTTSCLKCKDYPKATYCIQWFASPLPSSQL